MSDWNKTEVITVPKGFYGWRTKGRLRYEDKVFRFPVGQATSLPAPVVEHLRKLIELPEEERPEQPHKYSANSTFTTDAEGNPVWSPVDVTALTEEMLTTEAKAELAALCPEIFEDPDVKILYDPDRTEIAEKEFWQNTNIQVAYFPKVVAITGSDIGIGLNFAYCSALTDAIFPVLKTMEGTDVFSQCTALKRVYAPKLEQVFIMAFGSCTSLEEINLPSAVNVGRRAFLRSNSLRKVDIGANLSEFGNEVFCYTALDTLILRATAVPTLGSKVFYNTPIASGTGYIYVPAALIEDYKVAANWSTYAAQFRAIEDYPDICAEDADECITKAEAAALIDSKLEGAGGGAQPDWNQTDETAADYVKNRTHGIESMTERARYSATTTETDHWPSDEFYNLDIENHLDGFITVIWDGVEYPFLTYDTVNWRFGDESMPFTLIWGEDGWYLHQPDESGAEHTFTIIGLDAEMKALDPMWLPDALKKPVVFQDQNSTDGNGNDIVTCPNYTVAEVLSIIKQYYYNAQETGDIPLPQFFVETGNIYSAYRERNAYRFVGLRGLKEILFIKFSEDNQGYQRFGWMTVVPDESANVFYKKSSTCLPPFNENGSASPFFTMESGYPMWSETITPILRSSTEGSTKKFKITVDDSGALTATEVT